MTRVYSHPDPAITHLVRNALEQIGVTAIVRGERNGAAMGEVPPVAAWSEVWVPDDARLDEVQAVVDEATAEVPTDAEPWTCPACGEEVGGQFAVCWACGTPSPEMA